VDRVVPEFELEDGDRVIVGQTVLELAIVEPEVARALATRSMRTERTELAVTDITDVDTIYESLRRDRETLLAIYEMERKVHLEFDPARMRERVLEAVLDAYEGASSVSIAAVDRQSLQITEVSSLAAAGQEPEQVSQYMAHRAVRESKAVCSDESRIERAGAGPVVAQTDRCVMCAPLWTGRDLWGVIQVFSSAAPSRFSAQDLELLTVFASRASVALANAELNEERQRTAHFRELTDYLANELRGAATGLVGWLAPLEEGKLGQLAGLQLEAVRTARMGAQMVSTMVTSMTDLAQLKQPNAPVKLEPVRLDTAVAVPFRLAREMAACHGIAEPIYRPEAGLPPVIADSELLQRVVLNLMLFGMAWGEASAPVILTAGRKDGTGLLSVEWSGDQVPEKHREDIFDPDTQAKLWKSMGRRSVGTGLAFCSLAVRHMGGRIWLGSPTSGNSLKVALLLASQKTG